MSFKRFDLEDLVISSDGISAPAWSNNAVSLTAFYTSSDQVAGESGDYYYNVYQTASTDDTAAIQFAVSYGDLPGSGSLRFNSNVASNSPSSAVYKQIRTLVNGTEETKLSFAGHESEHIYAISIERARYKEKLLPGSLTLKLTSGSNSLTLTDDSEYTSTETFTDAGREYNLISGSEGVKNTSINSDGYTNNSGSYGKFLPDVGLILLSGKALDLTPANGGASFDIGRQSNTDEENIERIYDSFQEFTLRSEETVSSNYVFVRARNGEFNYSTNPSNITGSGELRHSIMVDTPQSYITAVGLYNDNNDLLAVAKLSRPLLKDFTKEALLRIKLDY